MKEEDLRGRGLNPPGQEGSEEFTPNVGNRRCPRWGVGGLMEMVVSRGGSIETEWFQGANPIYDSSLPSAHNIINPSRLQSGGICTLNKNHPANYGVEGVEHG